MPKSDEGPDEETTGERVELADIVDELPAGKKQALIRVLAVSRTETIWSSLPPPEAYARYVEVFPDAADRILTIAEKEQQIRAEAQSRVLANDSRKIHGAIFLGFSLIALAGVAIWAGHEIIALPFGLAGTLAALTRSLLSRRDRTRRGTQ